MSQTQPSRKIEIPKGSHHRLVRGPRGGSLLALSDRGGGGITHFLGLEKAVLVYS